MFDSLFDYVIACVECINSLAWLKKHISIHWIREKFYFYAYDIQKKPKTSQLTTIERLISYI